MTSNFPAVTKQKLARAFLPLQKSKFHICKVKEKRQQNTDANCGCVGGIYHLYAPGSPNDRL